MRTFMMLIASTLALVLGGCIDFAPAYKQELLTYDEGLVGVWIGEVRDGKEPEKVERFPVRIEKREASVTAGRLGDFNATREEPKPRKSPVPAYLVTITFGPNEQGVAHTRRYEAVLLKVEGVTVLAYQLSREEPALKDTFGDVLPVHQVVRVERTGDVVRVRDMKHKVVWMPAIRTLYAEAGEARLPTGESGMWLVTDADRFTDVLKLAVRAPDEWNEGVSLKRE